MEERKRNAMEKVDDEIRREKRRNIDGIMKKYDKKIKGMEELLK